MQRVRHFTVPLLYRHILKAAQVFPSIKRESIVNEIKTEFRSNKDLKDEAQINEKLQIAVRGLEELERYTSLDPKSQEWTIHLKGMCVEPPIS